MTNTKYDEFNFFFQDLDCEFILLTDIINLSTNHLNLNLI